MVGLLSGCVEVGSDLETFKEKGHWDMGGEGRWVGREGEFFVGEVGQGMGLDIEFRGEGKFDVWVGVVLVALDMYSCEEKR